MPKQMKSKPAVSGEATLQTEEEVMHVLLSTFASHGVRALMILEKDGTVKVRGTNFRSRALLPFLVDLFLSNPELYRACTEMIRDIVSGSGEEAVDGATVH
jgi:hypothetical protein